MVLDQVRVVLAPLDPAAVISTEDVRFLVHRWNGNGNENIVSVKKTGSNSCTVTVIDILMAARLIDDLMGTTVNGNAIRISIDPMKNEGRSFEEKRRSSNSTTAVTASLGSERVHSPNLPLRMLVSEDFIGALIGTCFSTIRSIMDSTGTDVDVLRLPGIFHDKQKVVIVLGSPENTSAACRKIVEIMAEESRKKDEGDVCLRILTSDNLIERIIGKGGMSLAQMMRETETVIYVSHQCRNEEHSHEEYQHEADGDRIITIRGSIDAMCLAERLISSRLKQAYESDRLSVQMPNENLNTNPGVTQPQRVLAITDEKVSNDSVSLSVSQSRVARVVQPEVARVVGPQVALVVQSQGAPVAQPQVQRHYNESETIRAQKSSHLLHSKTSREAEASYIYIPDRSVGLVIGTGGSTIRNIIRASGAPINMTKYGVQRDGEKKLAIHGPFHTQWKAQFLIFETLKNVNPGKILRLRIEFSLPSDIVGQVIGEGGSRIKEIQESTGIMIKHEPSKDDENRTIFQLCGPCNDLRGAQMKIKERCGQIKQEMWAREAAERR